MPLARPKPTVLESDQMTKAMERRLFDIVSGKSSPQEGLDALALDLQRILDRKAQLRYPVRPLPSRATCQLRPTSDTKLNSRTGDAIARIP